jgi:hypothetical protein
MWDASGVISTPILIDFFLACKWYQIPHSYKSPGSDQIPVLLTHARGEEFVSAIRKRINSIWSKAELPDHWKQSVIVPVYKRVIKLNNNYREISLLSKLSPYIDEIVGDHQCRLRHNRPTADQTFCICQLLGKNWNPMRECICYYRIQESM